MSAGLIFILVSLMFAAGFLSSTVVLWLHDRNKEQADQ